MPPADAGGAPPFVSIVFTGRNDGYGGDFVERFLTTLRFNSRELCARGISHEFVLVEWAPPPDAPLLIDLVDAQCPPSVTASFRDIVVDAAYHTAVNLNPRVPYQEFIAKNVGLRHARGEYVVSTNCDVFFGRPILDRLQRRELEAGILYRAPRWDLKAEVADRPVDWAELDDPDNLARPRRTLEPPYFRGAAADFIALDRATFERLGGFNEVYRLTRVGIDGNLLTQAVACGVSMLDIGGPVYHIDHAGSYRTTRAQYAGREHEAPYGDERWASDVIVYRNGVRWGLHGAPERQTGPRRTAIDFSWDAVPPLVDLSGIRLPETMSGAAPVAQAPAPALPAVEELTRSLGDAKPADALARYQRALAECRAVTADVRQALDRMPDVHDTVRTFAHRRRKKADKIAARGPAS
jgi:hypothetical protein